MTRSLKSVVNVSYLLNFIKDENFISNYSIFPIITLVSLISMQNELILEKVVTKFGFFI